MLTTVFETTCLVGLTMALVTAAVTDLRCRIVPNGCAAAVAVSGLARASLVVATGLRGPLPILWSLGGVAVVFAAMLCASYAGILPAYHMNKAHWITVRLDGSVPDGEIEDLLLLSRELTARKKRGV